MIGVMGAGLLATSTGTVALYEMFAATMSQTIDSLGVVSM